MKKIILTSLFLALFFCNAYSADEGSIFTYFVTNPDGQYETLFLTYDRNVELDGKNYQQYIGSYCDRTYADSLVLLRREGKKYFCHDTQTSEEHLLFDFGLQKGDTFTDDFSGMVYDVIDVRDSLINDSLHRLIEIRDCEGTGKHDIWLENVGSIYTGILPKNKFQDVCLLIYFHFYYSIEEDVEHSTYFFPNTPQIKTAGMSVTEPQWDKDFKPEEDWDAFLAWLHAPTDLNAEFENGTLHIWGRLRTSCSIQTYAACELNGDKITFMVYPYNNLLDEDCISSYEVETRIPGFERGHYELKLYNKTIELECAGAEEPREYYPEGTKWTEIRLDTLKYDSWYSKIGDEWVPNFETIEYRVQGEYVDERYNDKYLCVYTNGPEWTDSLTLLLYNHRIGNDDVGWCGEVTVAALENNGQLLWPFCGQLYPLSWEVGTTMSSLDIEIAGTTGVWPWEWDEYGTVEEIKEGDFGGVKPLKYSDVNGIRFIQGIGVASWNDGECIFGPIKPYQLLSDLEVLLENDDYYWNKYPVRHYRSMLVHFERDGEVLYDVWPQKESSVEVAIDGLNYYLDFNKHEAIIDRDNTWSGELDIPSEVIYEGQRFVVKSMIWCAFANCPELTRVRIPKTIESVTHHVLNGMNGAVSPDHMNPFMGCTALESVEVDEENPSFKSVDGVFFSQDGKGQYYIGPDYFNGTGLYCYPAGKLQESYIIPEGVEWIGATAFEYSQHLTTLTIPSTMICIYGFAFKGCSNLTDVYCNAENVPKTNKQAFTDCPLASATLHVPAGSVDLYKSTYPWSEFGNIVAIAQDSSPTLEDLLAEAESLLFGCSYVRSSQGTKKAVLYYSIKEKEEIEGIKYSNLFIDVVELSALQDGIHEMVFIDEKYPGEPTCTDVLLIRQDGDKVYCQTEDDTQEWLILDFGLKMGDIFVNGAGERFLVKEITKSDDSKRKRILLISEDGTQEDTWEEGIGSLQWGFLPNYVVKTLKYFQDVEDSMFTNLWAAANPDYFMEQGVYDENFKLQPFDEIKDEAAEDMTLEDLPDSPLSYSFIENSLRIQGYYPLNLYPSFAAASITGGHIDISIHQVTGLNIIKGNHIAKIDVLIPGFKAGTYEVGMSGQEYVTLECKGSSAQYNDPVTFTKDLMATIILPTAPDASKGKYYRLDRCEDNQIIFEQELQPQARVPYVIVPNEDFTIDPSTLDLAGLSPDTVSIAGISFIGTYTSKVLPSLGGDGGGSFYIDIIDTTPDCQAEEGKAYTIGALRAYLTVNWDDPINHDGSKGPGDKLEIVLKDNPNSLTPTLSKGEGDEIVNGKWSNGKWFDLSGRRLFGKPARGIYIEDGKKKAQ